MRKNLLAFGVLVIFVFIVWMIEMLREILRPATLYLGMVITGLVALVLALTVHFASARDFGQWQMVDPETRDWYETLMQPDNPAASCCGEADSYFCDDPHTKRDYLGNARNFCTITDERPDEPRRRRHIEIGTEIEIPDVKIKRDQGNPTGHGVVFLSRGNYVYCYAMGGGV